MNVLELLAAAVGAAVIAGLAGVIIGVELEQNRRDRDRAAGDLADFLRHVLGEHRMTPGITFWPESDGTTGAFLELPDGTVDDLRLPVGLDALTELAYRLNDGDVQITRRVDAFGAPWVGFVTQSPAGEQVATTRPADLGRRRAAQAARDRAFLDAWRRTIADDLTDDA